MWMSGVCVCSRLCIFVCICDLFLNLFMLGFFLFVFFYLLSLPVHENTHSTVRVVAEYSNQPRGRSGTSG